MRLPSRYTERSPIRFNITPLIDVVFLLIIFFLVASHFVRSEQAAPVELPRATSGQTDNQQAPHRLTVTVSRAGEFSVAGIRLTESEVLKRINELQASAAVAEIDPEVRLRGHKDGRYGPFRHIIEHCAARGIRSIRFAVTLEDPN